MLIYSMHASYAGRCSELPACFQVVTTSEAVTEALRDGDLDKATELLVTMKSSASSISATASRLEGYAMWAKVGQHSGRCIRYETKEHANTCMWLMLVLDCLALRGHASRANYLLCALLVGEHHGGGAGQEPGIIVPCGPCGGLCRGLGDHHATPSCCQGIPPARQAAS